MAVVKVSRVLGSAAVVGGVVEVEAAVDGAAVVAGAAEAPGTRSDIPDTRVLWALRRKYEWLVGGRGLGSRRDDSLTPSWRPAARTAGAGREGAGRQGERDNSISG